MAGQKEIVADACQRLQASDIRVSIFIDAEQKQITAASEAGATVIEIHTGHYADAENSTLKEIELKKIIAGVKHGTCEGLQINAGHGLNYQNVRAIAAIAEIEELNIGHSIIALSIFTGIEEAVRRMKQIMLEARQ